MNLLTLLAPAGVIAYALNLLLHLTVICLVVLGASHLFFRRDPAMRHTLCLTGLVCLLLAPIVVGMETKAGSGLVTLALPSVASTKGNSSSVRSATDKPYRVAISAMLPTQPVVAWGGWAMLAAYMLGVGCGALRLAHGCRRASRLKQDVSPWKEAAGCLTLHTPERVLPPAPPVFTSPHVASPIAIGLLHPAIILPEGLAETLSPRQLRHVLLHEYAHVAFRHGLGGLLERIAGVLFWPHPLVRMLCRELGRAREEVCDNFASQEDGATCYARTLLTIAQGIDTAPHLISTLALLGAGTSLESRITGLLDPRRDRMVSLKRWKWCAAAGTALFTIASTAVVRIVTVPDHTSRRAESARLRADTLPPLFADQLPRAALRVTPPTMPRRRRVYVWRMPNANSRKTAAAHKMTLKLVSFRVTTGGRKPQPRPSIALCKAKDDTILAIAQDSEKPNTAKLGTAGLDTPAAPDRVYLSGLMQTEPDTDRDSPANQEDLFILLHATSHKYQDPQSDVPSDETEVVVNAPLNDTVANHDASVSLGMMIGNSVLDTTELESLEAVPAKTVAQKAESTEIALSTARQSEEALAPQAGFAWKVDAEAVAAQATTGARQDLEGYDMVEDLMGDKADASQAMKVTLDHWPHQEIEQNKTQRIDLPEKTAIE